MTKLHCIGPLGSDEVVEVDFSPGSIIRNLRFGPKVG